MSTIHPRRIRRISFLLVCAVLLALLTAPAALAAATKLEGVVTDAGDGWPASYINVDVRYWNGVIWLQELGTLAGSSGRFSVDVTPRTYRVALTDLSGRYVNEVFHNAASLDSGTDLPVAAGSTVVFAEQLVRTVPQISGRIVDSVNGDPIWAIEIAAFKYNPATTGWDKVATRLTRGDGRYAFAGLADGTYRLRYQDLDMDNAGAFMTEWYDNAADLNAAKSLTVTAASRLTADAVLHEIPGIIGTVTDNMSSAPIGGVYVKAVDAASDNFAGSAYTKPDGSYAIYGLSTGTYHVKFEPHWPVNGYNERWYHGKADASTADVVNVTSGATTSHIDDTLVHQFASLYGTVKSSTTGTGLGNVGVSAYHWDGTRWAYVDGTQTDDAGKWTLYGMLPDTYRIYFRPYNDIAWIPEWFDDKSEATATNVAYNGINSVAADATIAHVVSPVKRLAGSDRYETAVAIARAFSDHNGDRSWKAGDWLQPVHEIVIASGESRAAADPLAASSLCTLHNAPLFLVSAGRTPASVIAAVREIATANGNITIHVVGGTASVPDARINEVKAAVAVAGKTATVNRLASSGDRYDLAAAIARHVWEHGGYGCDRVLIANGADPDKFFDALALSTISAGQGVPILLVKSNSVPAATSNALWHLQPKTIVVGGGPTTVSNAVVSALGAERWYGANRYSTAATIATKAMEKDWMIGSQVAVASALPDALTGGAAVGRWGGALLLVKPTALPAETGNWIEAHDADSLGAGYVLGGTTSVNATTYNSVKSKIAVP